MKRTVFVGPSLHGIEQRPMDIEFLPPARQGDLLAAVEHGATWIGLIDGFFGTCASVWHKEILYALSRGCHVWGAASMGALRAAECQRFGMVPVGAIASAYAAGELVDDSEVALIHGPREVDYAPFTEALVDARATIGFLLDMVAIAPSEAEALAAASRSLHFSVRTIEAILDLAIQRPDRRYEIALLWERHRIRAKRADALLLLEQMAAGSPMRKSLPQWQLALSPSLSSLLRRGQSSSESGR